jgi:lysozyme
MELSEWEKWLLKELRKEEGLRLIPYNDHLGFATVGYGHLIAKRNVTPEDLREWADFSLAEAEDLLYEDLSNKIVAVRKRIPFFDALDGPRKTVLIGMAFQMGVEGLLEFKTMLKALDKGLYKEAGMAMMNSLWAKKQTPKRAKKLVERMVSGKWGEL